MAPLPSLHPPFFRLTPRSLRLIRSPRPLITSTSSTPSPSRPIPPHSWRLTPSGAAIEKDFKFKNFTQAWGFMGLVAARSERVGHHPEWWNVYNKVTIKWTTHSARALTVKDTEMARACDEIAEEMGKGKNT